MLYLNKFCFARFLSRWVVAHRWADGDIYDGEWMDDKKHGHGKETSVPCIYVYQTPGNTAWQ
jgi:hypothetical protein